MPHALQQRCSAASVVLLGCKRSAAGLHETCSRLSGLTLKPGSPRCMWCSAAFLCSKGAKPSAQARQCTPVGSCCSMLGQQEQHAHSASLTGRS